MVKKQYVAAMQHHCFAVPGPQSIHSSALSCPHFPNIFASSGPGASPAAFSSRHIPAQQKGEF